VQLRTANFWYNIGALRAWLELFRVVNLPTVPGDVLVGLSAVLSQGGGAMATPVAIVAAALASVLIYMFGLVDNDIIGAKTDVGRPIADGRISLRAARIARGLCLFAAMILGAVANLPPEWWIVAFLLAVAVVVYNRTKWCLVMGLCRGLDVLAGAAVLGMRGVRSIDAIFAAVVWTLYIAGVTWYSEGEENDPARKQRVGWLVGGIVYLQLMALLFFPVKPLLIAGAILLVVLRLMRRMLPKVSAS